MKVSHYLAFKIQAKTGSSRYQRGITAQHQHQDSLSSTSAPTASLRQPLVAAHVALARVVASLNAGTVPGPVSSSVDNCCSRRNCRMQRHPIRGAVTVRLELGRSSTTPRPRCTVGTRPSTARLPTKGVHRLSIRMNFRKRCSVALDRPENLGGFRFVDLVILFSLKSEFS